MIARRGVRPTLLQPFWNFAGFALGAATAAIGPEAAMACMAAVETEIDKHYSEQLDALGDDDPELSAAIAEFRAEELEHRDTALASGAERAPAYPLMSGLIRLGCRIAIATAKRIRSEEHTSELQSLMRISYAVFCWKKKKEDCTILAYLPK